MKIMMDAYHTHTYVVFASMASMVLVVQKGTPTVGTGLGITTEVLSCTRRSE
ncbi:sodium:phosphate symporter [Anopheles sinensis]|uniref:Sodium:phosphate symporter n=1 Tax=Anopheles sinensis TaxID=74873 RepID=A0A084VCQ2_ANOSI|nr:sodium:phosphate symporter [Anopheles sinensis]